jgi:hypothetical protein
MTIKQISVFLENRPGHLAETCRALADAGVSIITLSLADTREFGIARLIVDNWEKARDILSAAGRVVNVRDVVAVTVADRPGGMADVLAALDAAGVNVEYSYAFAFHHGEKAVLVFRFENNAHALEALAAAGITVLAFSDILSDAS